MKVILFTFETMLSFLEHFPVQLYSFIDSETRTVSVCPYLHHIIQLNNIHNFI